MSSTNMVLLWGVHRRENSRKGGGTNLRRSKEGTLLSCSWPPLSCPWDALQVYPAPTPSTPHIARGHPEQAWGVPKQGQDLIRAIMETLRPLIMLELRRQGRANQQTCCLRQHQRCVRPGEPTYGKIFPLLSDQSPSLWRSGVLMYTFGPPLVTSPPGCGDAHVRDGMAAWWRGILVLGFRGFPHER
jgi:hypothetical protein